MSNLLTLWQQVSGLFTSALQGRDKKISELVAENADLKQQLATALAAPQASAQEIKDATDAAKAAQEALAQEKADREAETATLATQLNDFSRSLGFVPVPSETESA